MPVAITTKELQEIIAQRAPLALIDVRRKADYDTSPTTINGAIWLDPEKVEEWQGTLPENQQVVVYCMRGGSVSQGVATALQKSCPSVRFLEGGIAGWEKMQND